MNHKFRTIARLFGVMIGFASFNADATTIEIRPVGGEGNDITVLAGTQVTLEIFVSNYAPNLLSAYQVDLDPAGFSNGVGAGLVPFIPACTNTPECETALGVGASCDSNTHPPGCTAGLINTARSDYIFALVDNFASTYGDETYDYRWGSAILDGSVQDPGGLVYLATLVVDIPLGASGTYTLEPDPFPDTSLVDDKQQFLSDVTLVPANIVVSGSIPTMSEWGLATLTLLTACAGTVIVRRRTGFARAG